MKWLRREAESAAESMTEVEQLNLRSLDDQLSQPKKGNNAILLPLVEEVFDISKILSLSDSSQDSGNV